MEKKKHAAAYEPGFAGVEVPTKDELELVQAIGHMSALVNLPEVQTYDVNKITPENPETATFAVNAAYCLRAYREDLIAQVKPMKDAWYRGHKATVAWEKAALAPIDHMIDTITKAIAAYHVDVQALHINMTDAIAEEAERNHRWKILELVKAGKKAEAKELREAGPTEVVKIAEPELPAGCHQVTRWHAEVEDYEYMVSHLGVSDLKKFTTPHMSCLNQEARTSKEDFDVPGCEAVAVTTIEYKKEGV